MQVGLSFTPYLERAATQVSSSGAAASQSHVEYLRGQLDGIDKYGVEGATKVEDKEVGASPFDHLVEGRGYESRGRKRSCVLLMTRPAWPPGASTLHGCGFHTPAMQHCFEAWLAGA